MALSRQQIVPLVVACAMFMEQIDGTVITTAVPRIAEALHTDPVHLNLAVSCYMLSLAVFIPLSGWIADRFGAKNVFRFSIVVFIVGSVACGLASSLWFLVLSRIFQGLGGAMMVPVGRLALLKTIPKNRLVDAMALMTAPALLGPILGAPIGGIIVTYFSWRWIFFINVPIGILGIVMVSRYIDNIYGNRSAPLDLSGFLLMAVTLAGLMFGFETVGRNLVSTPTIVGVTTVSVFCLFFYLVSLRKRRFPILDLRPLRYPTYRSAMIGGSFFRISIGAMPFLLPLFFQYGFGMSPAMSGFMTLGGAAGSCLMKILSTRVLRITGFKNLLIGNSVLNAFYFALCAAFSLEMSIGYIFAFLLMGGIFRSIQFMAINSVAFADIPDRLLSRANTFYNMMQQLTLSLGVAVGALALNVSLRLRDATTPQISDFGPVFIFLAVITLLALVSYIPLPANAGDVLRDKKGVSAEGASQKDIV